MVDGPGGETFVVDTIRGPDQRHGNETFSRVTGRLPAMLASFTPLHQRGEIDVDRVAFIDTETTGLGYGAGTQVFMVGVGHKDGDAFRVRQFFLRHPGDEPAMLANLADLLGRFEALVSFNGRSFDWPLIENRFILQRIGLQPSNPLHVDLLYVSRRLWKLRLESCGLASVEQAVLGVDRSRDDVPGWMVPQLYFQYLRSGNAGPLKRVFYHNLQDILSLAMLSVEIASTLEDPWKNGPRSAVDFFSLARLYHSQGNVPEAVRCFEHALKQGLPPALEPEAMLRLAMVHKGVGAWTWALPLLERLTSNPGYARIACVELAKYHEHVVHDFQEALRLTMQALRIGSEEGGPSWEGIGQTELLHRRNRLRMRGAER